MERADIRRHCRLLAAALALALAVWVVNWARTPELTEKSFPGDGAAVPAGDMQLHGCRYDGSYIRVTGGQAYILLGGLSGSVQSVAVRLDSEPPPGEPLRLYYPDGSGSFSTDRMWTLQARAGLREYLFQIPAGEYPALRLDIPADLILGEISVSQSPLIKSTHVMPPLSPWGLGAFFMVAAALLEAGLRFRLPGALGPLLRSLRAALPKLAPAVPAGAVPALAAWPVCTLRGIPYTAGHAAFFFLLGAVLWGLWLLRPGGGCFRHQRVFALLSLGLGFMFMAASPLTSYADEQGGLHFRRALCLSYGGSAYVSQAESRLMGAEDLPPYADIEANRSFAGQLEGWHSGSADYLTRESLLSYPFPLYVPGALGLWLGRFLGLGFTADLLLGRTANLLAYTLAMCGTVRLCRRGKALACAAGLAPPLVFRAAAFSPGGLAAALCMLAAVLFFRLQGTDLRARLLRAGLACGVAGCALAVLPWTELSQGIKGQWADILSAPLALIKSVIKLFLRDISWPGLLSEAGSFANLPVRVPGGGLMLAVLGAAALTEPEDVPLPDPASPGRRALLAAALCAAALVPACLFGPEAFRAGWLLPLLFPALYALRPARISSSFSRGRYLYAVLAPGAALTVVQLWRILRCYR